jgi:acyl-CoA dehydrogenase
MLTELDCSGDFPEDLYQRLAAAAFLRQGLPSPGADATHPVLRAVVAAETLARYSSPLASMYLVNSVFGGACIALGGTPEQKQEWLGPLMAGRLKVAFAMTEPGAGSDATGITTTAVVEGDEIRINGQKRYTTGAAVADFIITVARTNAEHSRSMGLVLVPRDAAGLTIQPTRKLAGNSLASCDVRYQDVRVPIQLVIGGLAALESGWNVLKFTGALERLAVAATCVGLVEAVVAETRRFAQDRRQFGQPIAQFQAIQHLLVEMATEARIMRLLTYSAASKADRGEMAALEISMAKYYCSEKAQEIMIKGMRIFGGAAYFDSCPMSRRFREAPLALYAGGTIEIQKNTIARLLGLQR